MRNKIVLRSISVAAAALACAVWSLAGCSSPSSGFGDGSDKQAVKAASLTALSVVKTATGENLISFDPEIPGYTIDFTAADLASPFNLSVSAEPEEGAQAFITVDNKPLQNGGEFAAPALGSSKQITIETAFPGAEGATVYSISLNTPKSEETDTHSLKSLIVRYSELSANLTPNGFLNNGNGTITIENGKTSLQVTAEARSSLSTVEIYYKSTLAATGSQGDAQTTITALPGVGQEEELTVVVHKADGTGSRSYKLTIRGPTTIPDTVWQGTVTYGAFDYEITGVTAKQAASSRVVQAELLSFVDDETVNGRNWKVSIPYDFRLSGFTVTIIELNAPEGRQPKVKESNILPLDGRTSTDSIELTLSADDTGIRIYNAIEFFNYLNGSAAGESYALADNIDLDDYVDANNEKGNWTGTTGFNKNFFGNNYTIKNLALSKASGPVGLFSTLTNGAKLSDFTVEVSTKNPEMTVTSSWFGGVVGRAYGVVEITNVKVTGSIIIKNISTFAGIGALVGTADRSRGSITKINKCVADLNIEVTGATNVANNTSTNFGGLIGTMVNTAIIENSYSTGNIIIRDNTTSGLIIAGGLVGFVHTDTGDYNDYKRLTIINSYSSGDVIIDKSGVTANPGSDVVSYAGGLVGLIGNANKTTEIIIKNSAALGKTVKVILPANAARVLGKTGRVLAKNLKTDATIFQLENNFALEDMDIAPLGTDDQLPNTKEGKSVSAEDFALAATWTGPAEDNSGLGWSDSVWDFSKLSAEDWIWPVLKKAK